MTQETEKKNIQLSTRVPSDLANRVWELRAKRVTLVEVIRKGVEVLEGEKK